MIGHGIKFWNSFVVRFALFFTGLIVFAILLSGYLVYRKSSGVITEAGKERIRHSAELAEQAFSALLTEVANDIAFISSDQALKSYISDQNSAMEPVKLLFENILTNKPNYFQIRLINRLGEEIVRFDKTADSIFAVTESALQNKGARDYFQEAINIGQGEYYFSRINLNEEYGVISSPEIPTLRAASPLATADHHKFGIVIINVDLSNFYTELTRISASGVHFHLVDEDGQYLYTPDHQKEFGLQRGSGASFERDFNVDVTKLSAAHGSFNDYSGTNYLYYLEVLEFFQAQRKINLVATLDENILLQSARGIRKESLKSLTVVCILSLLLSFLFTRLFSNQINLITQAISNYEDGKSTNDIPTQRKDEIGVLARSFAAMRDKINYTLKDLNTALYEEKKSRAQRDQLLQNMSHELRTPLHTIQGLTELLKKNKPIPAQVPIISSLSRSVQNLTGLVYDVLDHQKLIEGRLSLQLRPCNIGNVIEEIHKNYQFESLKKGLDFQLMCEEVLSTQEYLMDPLRLSQILTNLVINAIKYTDKGSIIMEACLISKAPGGYLEVTVSDTGVGIDEESLSQINTGKYQHGPVISGRYGSYGLGLSIVKQLVHLLGGKFKATSTIGVGSRFKVSLPIEPAENHHLDLPKVHPEKTLPSLSEQKVIVQLDDDISSLELFSHLIRSGQIKLIQFTRFDQMLEGLDRFRPHVVVSDLMLNEKHYTRELRMAIENRKISCPVIVVSAQEVEQSRNISPYAFQKPFDPGLLLDQIYTILGEKQYQKPIFKSIYDNYDFDTVKIERALTLLESEFLSLIPKLRELPASNSLDSWQLISHKLITHLRSLQMEKIEKIMARTDCIPNESTLGYLIDSLYYSLCAIRLEKWFNSRD